MMFKQKINIIFCKIILNFSFLFVINNINYKYDRFDKVIIDFFK